MFARGTVTIGTNGVGWGVVMPCLANDFPIAVVTNAPYAASAVAVANTSTSNMTVNSPYDSSQFYGTNAPLQGRIVSVGASLQYTGTVLNQGGMVYAFVMPNRRSVEGLSSTQVAALANTKIARVTSKKVWITTAGKERDEFDYSMVYANSTTVNTPGNIYPFQGGAALLDSNTTGTPIMGFFVTGTPGNTFQIEVVQHVELIGSGAQNMLTPTHCDTRSFEIVNTASQRLQAAEAANPEKSTVSLLREAILDVAREAIPVVASGIRSGIASGIGGSLGRLTLGN